MQPTVETFVRAITRTSTDIASTNKEPAAESVLFSVTNHTDRTIFFCLPTIEVNAGSNWITQAGPFTETLVLATPGSSFDVRHLKAHETAEFTLHLCPFRLSGGHRVIVGAGVNWLDTPPPGKTWRLRVTVQDVLTGFADASRRAQEIGPYVKDHLTGNTNSWRWSSPFSKNRSYFGDLCTTAVSDEVSVQ